VIKGDSWGVADSTTTRLSWAGAGYEITARNLPNWGSSGPSRRPEFYAQWIPLAPVEAILILDWLLEHNVSALIRVDAERGKRPWTFHASGGPLAGSWVRVDAETPEECLRRAVEQLSQAGLEVPV
jgi:hypothetical protein